MRIILEKNLAFKDQPKPILAKDVATKIKPRKALKSLGPVQLDISFNLPTQGRPKIQAILDQSKRPVLRVINFKVGQHVFPPNVPIKMIPTLGAKSETFSKPLVAEGLVPDHLDVQPVPHLPAKLRTPPFSQPFRSHKDTKIGYEATTVFPPDDRIVFGNLNYPYCTCGRVDTPIGTASGVMVGPRHLLTVSHIIQWNSDNTTGWVLFRPDYFAPSEPFGRAWAAWTYCKWKVTGPTIDTVENMYDYVCCVLDWPIGQWTGWMGAKGYTDWWDGGVYWTHIGYPGDLTSCNKPTVQFALSLNGNDWEPDSHEAMSHWADVWRGQSGGPFFGWWDGEVWPSVVCVQSCMGSSENRASGGQDMVDIILRARNDFP